MTPGEIALHNFSFYNECVFDVLPPTNQGDDAFLHKSKKRRARMLINETKISPSPITGHTKPNLPPVVQMNWKLPARLRKPIRQQLQKERVEKKKREAIVRFERRSLTTQSVLSQPR